MMTMSTFTFADLTFKQLNGTAMGTPPAPLYATVYYGIHEEKFLPKYNQHIIFYQRFIDDVIGIWCPNQNPQVDDTEWNSFINKGMRSQVELVNSVNDPKRLTSWT